MIVEYPDHRDRLDFVVPTVAEAEGYIRDGAINGVELLIEAGMSEREAKLKLKRIKYGMLPGYVVIPELPELPEHES